MLSLLIGLLLIILYITVMCVKVERIPTSVSETYYLGAGIWFTIIFFISSLLIMMGMLDMTEGSNWQFISFLTASGMSFVGASPKFRENLEGIVHYIGALFLLIGSQIWCCIFSSPIVLISWIFSFFWINTSQRIFWVEITCIITMLLGFLFV